MRRRDKNPLRMLLAAALLYGSGAHWLLVQGAAWAGMLAARAGRHSVSEALTTTFDGLHPCRVCLLVKRGAGAGPAPAAVRPGPTVDFAFVSVPAAPAPAPVARQSSDAFPDYASRPRVPPSPPPDILPVA